MSSKQEFPYSEAALTRIHDHLVKLEVQGTPAYYQIKVDSFHAVSRTTDTRQFFHYKTYLFNEVTQQVEVFIFQGKSFHCNRLIYFLKPTETQIKEQKAMIDRAIELTLLRERNDFLTKQNESLKAQVKDLKIKIRKKA